MNYIIVAAIIHGFIFSALLISKHENKLANKLFVCMLFSILITIFTYAVLQLKLYNSNPWLHWLPFGASFTIAPAFYLFVKYLVNSNKGFNNKDLLHFTPLAFNYLHSVYHLIYGREIAHVEFHNFTESVQLLAILPGSVYLIYTFRLIKQYESKVREQFSNLHSRTLKWAFILLYIFVFIYGLILLFVIVDIELLFNYRLEFYEMILMPYDELLILSYCVATYWSTIGTYMLKQAPEILDAGRPPSKDFKAIGEKIIAGMKDDRLYLNPELSLRIMEDHLAIPAKEISSILNQYFKKNFYEFTNDFRVEEVKKRLLDKSKEHLTIEALAYDSGFNSKATFNRIFKEKTGQSPSNFRASQNN
ncbi:helix-turn-helix domain-containing protein [Ekhidna sp.]|uniref:helix-turn-helix domain-containing protein n=1 Tax=Ekhidna sp. TaxID=2608089 RepID=UPI003BA85D67